MIDLIGDIHGHAFELVQLLNKLGYRLEDGSYYHPDRKVCFDIEAVLSNHNFTWLLLNKVLQVYSNIQL